MMNKIIGNFQFDDSIWRTMNFETTSPQSYESNKRLHSKNSTEPFTFRCRWKSVWEEEIIELFLIVHGALCIVLIWMNELKVVHDEPKIQIFVVQQVNRFYSVCALVWIAGNFTSACRKQIYKKRNALCMCKALTLIHSSNFNRKACSTKFCIWQKVIRAMQSTKLHTPISSSCWDTHGEREFERERNWGKFCESASVQSAV